MAKLGRIVLLQIALIVLLGTLFNLPAYAESSIELNSRLTDTIVDTDDSNTYKLVIPEDGKIQFVLVPDSSLSTIMNLYGEDGTTRIKHTWESIGETINIEEPLMPGIYYLEVRQNSGFGSYTLTNTYTKEPKENDKEPNNSFLDAVSIEPNKTITGHLGFIDSKYTTDEKDWYEMVIPEDGKMQFVLVQESTLSTRMKLYGEDGTTVISHIWEGQGETINIVEPLMPGTYYLEVQRISGFGAYTLTNTYTKELKENDKEPNNSFLDAVPIEINKTKTGHLGFIDSKYTMDEKDWYKFVVPEDGKMQFVLVPESTLSTRMKLYEEDGTTIISHVWEGKGETISIIEPLTTGTYYLNINCNSGFGAYTLTSKFSGLVKHNKMVLTIGKPNMILNSESKEIDPGRGTTPIIINGRTMVPIRTIIETMGGTVGWNDSERKISIVLDATNIELWLGKKQAMINNRAETMDVEPDSINGRTMVPLRFVIENLNCDIKWDDSTKSVIIDF